MSNSAFTQKQLGAISTVKNETPSGTIDGANDDFTTASNYIAGSLAVYLNGVRLDEGAGNDFTEEGGNDFIMLTAPETDDKLLVDYKVTSSTHGNADTLDGYEASELWQLMYPVGAIYTSVVSTTPATLFGGTWVAIAEGRVLVGIDSGDTDFDTVEEETGAKTVAHDHTLDSGGWAYMDLDSSKTYVRRVGGTGSWTSLNNETTVWGGGSGTRTSGTELGGETASESPSVVQPSLVVYIWKRTA